MSVRTITKKGAAGGGSGTHGGAEELSITDAFPSLKIRGSDTIAVPTDAASFLLRATYADTIAAITETAKLNIRGLTDSLAAQSDNRSFTVRTWAAGCFDNDDSQTIPSRVNGANDASRAGVKTANAVGDLTNPVILTAPNFAVPNLAYTSKTLRIWFNMPVVVGAWADTATIVRNTEGTGEITLFTATGAAVDHNAGTFTADVSALSHADLVTLDVFFSYTAAVVASPQSVFNVDAVSIDGVTIL
jgi:hypothetical protein